MILDIYCLPTDDDDDCAVVVVVNDGYVDPLVINTTNLDMLAGYLSNRSPLYA